jgi:hypothetical protein
MVGELFLGLNALCVLGLGWRGWRAERALRAAEEQNALLRNEHALAARELVSLRKTNRSLHDHAERMGQRAKAFAVELRGSDGTAKTSVWPQRKHTVYDRTGREGS